MDDVVLGKESEAVKSAPPWKLRELTTNSVVRVGHFIICWTMLDRLGGTTNFFFGYIMICFSLLIYRCSRDVIKPNPGWFANVGVVIYIVGMLIGFLGLSGYLVSTFTDSEVAVCYINSNNRITSHYFSNKPIELIWIWLPVIIVSFFDWAFLKTWKEVSSVEKVEDYIAKKPKKTKSKKR